MTFILPDDIGNDKGMTARSPDDKSLFHMFSIYVAGALTGHRQDTTDTSMAGALFIVQLLDTLPLGLMKSG